MNAETDVDLKPKWAHTPLIGFPEKFTKPGKPWSEPWGEEWLIAEKKAFRALKAGGIVIFHGGRGTGKTRMAFELALEGCRFPKPTFMDECHVRRRPAIYKTAVKAFSEIRDTFHKNSMKTEGELIEEWSSAVLLVIDEIQEPSHTPFEVQMITAMIDSRYQAERPTIVIGNYESEEHFAASISPSIISRAQECGGSLHFDWPSYRPQIALKAGA